MLISPDIIEAITTGKLLPYFSTLASEHALSSRISVEHTEKDKSLALIPKGSDSGVVHTKTDSLKSIDAKPISIIRTPLPLSSTSPDAIVVCLLALKTLPLKVSFPPSYIKDSSNPSYVKELYGNNDIKQLLELLFKNKLIKKEEADTSKVATEEMNFAVLHYDSKCRRELFDKASISLLASKRYDLK